MTAGDDERVDVTLHGVELTWWPSTRLARMAFSEAASAPDGATAQAVSAQLERWVGRSEPWGFLVDCSTLETAQAGWRAIFADFFHEHGARSRIAWYDATPHLLVIIRMFVTGLQAHVPLVGEPFPTEDEARAFLAQHGFAA